MILMAAMSSTKKAMYNSCLYAVELLEYCSFKDQISRKLTVTTNCFPVQLIVTRRKCFNAVLMNLC